MFSTPDIEARISTKVRLERCIEKLDPLVVFGVLRHPRRPPSLALEALGALVAFRPTGEKERLVYGGDWGRHAKTLPKT